MENVWTNERLKKLATLARRGYTPSMMAKEIGLATHYIKNNIQEKGKWANIVQPQIREFAHELAEVKNREICMRDVALHFGLTFKSAQDFTAWRNYVNRVLDRCGYHRRKRYGQCADNTRRLWEFEPPKESKWAYHANGRRFPYLHGEPDLIAWCFKRSG